jgi:hypothetical protein
VFHGYDIYCMSFPGLKMTSVIFRSCESDIDDDENLDYEIIPFASRSFFIDDEFWGRP